MTEVVAGPFARALANAALFAGNDDTLPVLCAILVVTDGARLTIVGTDRFALLEQSFPCDHPPAQTVVERRDIDALLNVLADGQVRKWEPWDDGDVREGEWHSDPFDSVRVADLTIHPSGELRLIMSDRLLTVPPLAAEFPAYQKLTANVPDPVVTGTQPNLSANPALIGKLAKVRTSGAHWRFWQGEEHRAVFAVPVKALNDDRILALIMPAKAGQ